MPMQSMYWNGAEFEGSKDPLKLPLAGGTVSGNLEVTGALTVNASNVLTQADEGTGNGIDADTLDGQHATAFATSAQGTLATNALPRSGGTLTGMVDVPTATRSAGVYGLYDSALIGHIWSMGTGYKIADDGSTFGNTYGLAYKHTNNLTGGTMAGGHQIVVCSAGTPGVALGMAGGVWTSGNVTAVKVFGAVYNDYAESRRSDCQIEAGFVAVECDDGIIRRSQKRLMKMPMVVSDTYGFLIGEKSTDEGNTVPVAVSGRVLAHTDKPKDMYKIGDAVCSGINGTISKMRVWEKILFPERILGFVSEIPEYATWGEDNVKVGERIWIRVS